MCVAPNNRLYAGGYDKVMWEMVLFTVLIFFSACHYSERPVAMFKEAYKINAPFTVYVKTVFAGRVYFKTCVYE
jgi:hypothetical protein